MKKREIVKIVPSSDVMMGSFKIAQPLPASNLKQVDPFLLIHHAGPKYQEPGSRGLNVEAHPHTGFEPVTFVFSGEIEHRDSLGNQSIIRSGGVQWITAGKGIVHSEKASSEFIRKGGQFEIIQLWINLPRSLKKADPAYFGFEAEEIPYYLSDDKKSRLNIVSGKYKDIKGPVPTKTGITAYTALMEQEGKLDLTFDPGQNVIIYILTGNVIIDEQTIPDKNLIVFGEDGNIIKVYSSTVSKLLILAGTPIREPLFHYGPFVLNSKSEVVDAIKDYESGKMGYLD